MDISVQSQRVKFVGHDTQRTQRVNLQFAGRDTPLILKDLFQIFSDRMSSISSPPVSKVQSSKTMKSNHTWWHYVTHS